MLHGFYLACQRFTNDMRISLPAAIKRNFRVVGIATDAIKIIFVYTLVCLAWIFFRIHTFSDAINFIQRIAAADGIAVFHQKFLVLKIVGLILFTVMVDIVFISRRRVVQFLHRPAYVAIAMAFLLCLIEFFGSFGGGTFIYFQF